MEGFRFMRPHERLEAWSHSVDFVVRVYKLTETFHKEEKFGLTSQIRRAAVSIPSNIAEGAARNSIKEFMQFLSIAQGSASELETAIIVARRLDYLDDDSFHELRLSLERIGRLITGLSQHLKQKNT